MSPVITSKPARVRMVLLDFQYAHADYMGCDLPCLLAKPPLSPALLNLDQQHTSTCLQNPVNTNNQIKLVWAGMC